MKVQTLKRPPTNGMYTAKHNIPVDLGFGFILGFCIGSIVTIWTGTDLSFSYVFAPMGIKETFGSISRGGWIKIARKTHYLLDPHVPNIRVVSVAIMLIRWLLLLAAILYSLNQINHGAELMCRQHMVTYISENQDQNPQVVRTFPFQRIVKAARKLPFPFQLGRERVCKARCGFLAVLRYHPERCGSCWWQTPGDGRRAKIIWEYPDGTYYFFGAVVQSVALVWTFLKLGF